jgi:LmbE family N-acetylglucosaminyl deacetylase
MTEHGARVLAIGAHPDDVELGCGGALLRHAAAGDDITILVMTDGGRGRLDQMPRDDEQRVAAARLAADLRWGGFEDCRIPDGADAIGVIDDALSQTGAEILYTHASDDTHQDHRATAAASLAAGRRVPTILQYETPSSLHFDPTVFVDVDDVLDQKLALVRTHLSQVMRGGRVDLEALEAQMRFRGFQGRVPAAEGFELARLAWEPGRSLQTPAVVGNQVARVVS